MVQADNYEVHILHDRGTGEERTWLSAKGTYQFVPGAVKMNLSNLFYFNPAPTPSPGLAARWETMPGSHNLFRNLFARSRFSGWASGVECIPNAPGIESSIRSVGRDGHYWTDATPFGVCCYCVEVTEVRCASVRFGPARSLVTSNLLLWPGRRKPRTGKSISSFTGDIEELPCALLARSLARYFIRQKSCET